MSYADVASASTQHECYTLEVMPAGEEGLAQSERTLGSFARLS